MELSHGEKRGRMQQPFSAVWEQSESSQSLSFKNTWIHSLSEDTPAEGLDESVRLGLHHISGQSGE